MLRRDEVAFDPSLHRRMISMAQLAGYRANAASCADMVCVGHTFDVRDNVRSYKPLFNDETYEGMCDIRDMVNTGKIGERLVAIKTRSGLSLSKIAAGADYAGASSIQKYFNQDFDAEELPYGVAIRLAKAFNGTPVDPSEIMDLTNLGHQTNALPFVLEHDTPAKLARDIPVYGTALGATVEFDGEAIEQTNLDQGDVIDRFLRPPALSGKADVYGLYVQGSSMAPRFGEGEIAFVDGKQPPRIGDDVVVYLCLPDDHDGDRVSACLIKRLTRTNGDFIELEQFNPATTFKIDRQRIKRIHRVIPWQEMLS